MLHKATTEQTFENQCLLAVFAAYLPASHTSHVARPLPAGLEVAFLERTPEAVPTEVGESEFVGSSSPRLDLRDPGWHATHASLSFGEFSKVGIQRISLI